MTTRYKELEKRLNELEKLCAWYNFRGFSTQQFSNLLSEIKNVKIEMRHEICLEQRKFDKK